MLWVLAHIAAGIISVVALACAAFALEIICDMTDRWMR